jgi:Cd2+/Zn2+-exporting ATPase
LSVTAETGRATAKLIATMLGGMLVLASFLAAWLFRGPDGAEAGAFYRDTLAGLGALLLAVPLWWHALKALFSGHLHMDELVALAILAAMATGEYQTAGVVAFFLLLSILIETRTALGARAAIEGIVRLTPTKARRLLQDDSQEEVEAHALRRGDRVLVLPGDNIPADGRIIDGHSTINEANVTGESLPAEKAVGDEVFGGTSNVTGALRIEVTKVGHDTTLGRVRDLILEAERTKIPLMRLIDQYAAWYTPVTLMIAGVVWFFTKDMNKTIALLVIACPCALILATPTAIVAALSAAARLGVYIKDVSNLEWARKLTAVVFDKTGTLTTGQLAVSRLAPIGDTKPAELLLLAASAEKYSNHPTAKALATLAGEAGVPLAEPKDFAETAGRGVKAEINGAKILVGRAQWLKDNGIDATFEKSVDLNETEGWSLIFVAQNGKCVGWVGMQDQTRAEAKEALAELKEAGVRRIAMVSGDRQVVATRVAAEIGCEEAKGDCLPQNKVEFVRVVKAKGYKVAVIGDGVNDAPALAAGDIGIAMGAAGSEVAIHSATIALMNNDLRRLPFLVKLSRSTRAVINQNFLFGVVFIIVGLSAASFGIVGPIVAALLHNVGSLIVIFNSARLVRKGEELEHFHPEMELPKPGSSPESSGQLTPKMA